MEWPKEDTAHVWHPQLMSCARLYTKSRSRSVHLQWKHDGCSAGLTTALFHTHTPAWRLHQVCQSNSCHVREHHANAANEPTLGAELVGLDPSATSRWLRIQEAVWTAKWCQCPSCPDKTCQNVQSQEMQLDWCSPSQLSVESPATIWRTPTHQVLTAARDWPWSRGHHLSAQHAIWSTFSG